MKKTYPNMLFGYLAGYHELSNIQIQVLPFGKHKEYDWGQSWGL